MTSIGSLREDQKSSQGRPEGPLREGQKVLSEKVIWSSQRRPEGSLRVGQKVLPEKARRSSRNSQKVFSDKDRMSSRKSQENLLSSGTKIYIFGIFKKKKKINIVFKNLSFLKLLMVPFIFSADVAVKYYFHITRVANAGSYFDDETYNGVFGI